MKTFFYLLASFALVIIATILCGAGMYASLLTSLPHHNAIAVACLLHGFAGYVAAMCVAIAAER